MHVKPRAGSNGHAKDRVAQGRRECVDPIGHAVQHARDPRLEARDELVDQIAAWMNAHHPGTGVDVLLTRPREAIRLGVAVAMKAGDINRSQAGACERALAAFETEHGGALDAVNRICREAMCARKRGKLRSTKPTKGAQQA